MDGTGHHTGWHNTIAFGIASQDDDIGKKKIIYTNGNFEASKVLREQI